MLTGLGQLQVFRNGHLGLVEWIALTMLAKQNGITNKELAHSLGVTRERVNQVCKSLSHSGYTTISSQSGGDGSTDQITMTDAGRGKVEEINAQLKSLVASALQGRESSVANASKQLNRVMNVIRAGRRAGEDSQAPLSAGAADKQARRAANQAEKQARLSARAAEKQARRAAKQAEKRARRTAGEAGGNP
jgi:DNA-binding MarR family transcriptional regulator